MWSCTPFIKQTITEEVSWFRGEITKIEGGSKFPLSIVHKFLFYDEHTTCKSLCSNLALFRVHLPYLGDSMHFLGINAPNSSSNDRCMKGSTRMAWKTMLVPFSKFACLLQGIMDRCFDEMCVAIVNHKSLLVGFSTIENEINA